MRRLVMTLVVVMSLVACGSGDAPPGGLSGDAPPGGVSGDAPPGGLSGDAPPGGLSQSQAYAAARAASPDATGVVSGKAGQMRDFDTNQQVVPGDQWVWAVVVSGAFPFSCGPAPLPGQTHAPCPPPGTSMTVILDYKTGTFLEAFGQSGR